MVVPGAKSTARSFLPQGPAILAHGGEHDRLVPAKFLVGVPASPGARRGNVARGQGVGVGKG